MPVAAPRREPRRNRSTILALLVVAVAAAAISTTTTTATAVPTAMATTVVSVVVDGAIRLIWARGSVVVVGGSGGHIRGDEGEVGGLGAGLGS